MLSIARKRKQYAVSIKLDRPLLDKIEKVAGRLGVTPAQLVRMLIEMVSDEKKKSRRGLGKTVKQLTVQLDFELFVKLRRIAAVQERSKASVARRILRNAIDRRGQERDDLS